MPSSTILNLVMGIQNYVAFVLLVLVAAVFLFVVWVFVDLALQYAVTEYRAMQAAAKRSVPQASGLKSDRQRLDATIRLTDLRRPR